MTLFEKIIARQIPAEIVAEEETWIAFRDIAAQAPSHLLIVPKKPIPCLAEASAEDEQLLGSLLLAAVKIARKEGIDISGFRIVINNGKEGGEAVPHLHLHLLGGRQLQWPPG
ncbi:MAG: histidine triad nucleotide-binding protein [Verrucomicrobia bacterium RIFCSPHIGHO2_12_FULL_41_10]|nr:MAG: histidine triad nucleotide-binding protein [Verrucomicrobia bacterium RIFCSPHIGHO2_12_FULL_41_10]HLB32610.1 histidine triad nucleotide-binding protein [Chthoniobacterales bacterium]